MAGLYLFALVAVTWLTLASAAAAQVVTPAESRPVPSTPIDTSSATAGAAPVTAKEHASQPVPPPRSWLSSLSQNDLITDINGSGDGWTPRVDAISGGGGLAFGSAWRQPVFGGAARLSTDALFSVRGYRSLEGELSATPFRDRRITIAGRLRHDARPRDNFWGMGIESTEDDRTTYSLSSIDTAAVIRFAPKPWLTLEADTGYLNLHLDSGTSRTAPSIETRFTAADAPGLGMSRVGFLHTGLSIVADRRDDALLPTRGGVYRASATHYKGMRGVDGDFCSTELEARQFVQVPGTERHVLAFRALFASTGGTNDSPAPFYMQPRLGGRTLRGYANSRFLGPQALAFSAEHRFQLTSKLQLVGFMDAGQVADRVGDFDPGDFKTSFGGGIRYRIKGSAMVRLDVAAAEGRTRWVIGFGPTF